MMTNLVSSKMLKHPPLNMYILNKDSKKIYLKDKIDVDIIDIWALLTLKDLDIWALHIFTPLLSSLNPIEGGREMCKRFCRKTNLPFKFDKNHT